MGEGQSQIKTEPCQYGLAKCEESPERIVRPPHEGITIHDVGVRFLYLSMPCDASASCGGGKSTGDRREAAKEGAALFF